MQLVKLNQGSQEPMVGIWADDHIRPLALGDRQYRTLADILESDDPTGTADLLVDRAADPIPIDDAMLLAPIDEQEVWGAGVTYRRSQTARMDESKGAAWCYQKVYEAVRPELFFKATPHRVAGPGQPVRVRHDSNWTVPEPELVLVLSSRLRLVGFTIGNDMSSRDIEGENPLYLPQAKLYSGCCAIGPSIVLAHSLMNVEQADIELVIHRDDAVVFQGKTNVDQMARTFHDLIEWLGRENTFPQGVFLLTGTGIVPEDSFSLRHGDQVDITIDGLGTLSNPVIKG